MITPTFTSQKNLPDRICFRAMKTQDIPHLVKIDALSNNLSWTEKMFERELQLPFSFQVVAHLALKDTARFARVLLRCESARLPAPARVSPPEEKPVGFGIMWIPFDSAQLIQLAVAPDCRRKGVGQQLMKLIMNHARKCNCKKIELEFREGNLSAQKLYEKMGFVIVGRRKNLYPDCDGILMEYCF